MRIIQNTIKLWTTSPLSIVICETITWNSKWFSCMQNAKSLTLNMKNELRCESFGIINYVILIRSQVEIYQNTDYSWSEFVDFILMFFIHEIIVFRVIFGDEQFCLFECSLLGNNKKRNAFMEHYQFVLLAIRMV